MTMTIKKAEKQWVYSEFDVESYLSDLNAHRTMFAEILKISPISILEVGIGSGSMSIFLNQIGIQNVIGIDNSSLIIENAKNLSKEFKLDTKFILCDGFDLTKIFEKNSFDVVFSQGFFEHFDNNQIKRLLDEQLIVGKKVIFSVPSNYYPWKDFGNERLLNPKQWASILREYNVEYIKYYGYINKLKPIIYNLLKNPYPPILKPQHILIKINRYKK